MLKDSKTIKKIASKYNEHPIHIKMFFSQCKISILSEDECDKEYFKYLEAKPRPFVKWVGGKRQLARQFRDMDLYPPDDFDPEKAAYFEPFVGGGAMFFDLLPKRAVLSEIINSSQETWIKTLLKS